MPETVIHDFTDKTCGAIPAMGDLLRASEGREVGFRIKPHILPQVLNALGTDPAFDVRIQQELEATVLIFSRRAASQGPTLDYF